VRPGHDRCLIFTDPDQEKNDADDWDELAKETRLAKKFKKGKISKEEFDEETNTFDDIEQND
jgi:hypothetical protein